jgi:hypothetical protein
LETKFRCAILNSRFRSEFIFWARGRRMETWMVPPAFISIWIMGKFHLKFHRICRFTLRLIFFFSLFCLVTYLLSFTQPSRGSGTGGRKTLAQPIYLNSCAKNNTNPHSALLACSVRKLGTSYQGPLHSRLRKGNSSKHLRRLWCCCRRYRPLQARNRICM